MTEIPIHWDKAMRKANIGDPRNGNPSMRALAEKSGESPETIRRMVRGIGDPEPQTVASVAEALGISPQTVAKWVGHERHNGGADPFIPDGYADLMTAEERRAINKIIRLLTRGRRQE